MDLDIFDRLLTTVVLIFVEVKIGLSLQIGS